MGLENRDYYRDGSYTSSLTGWGVHFTPVVKYLISVNVIVFLLQICVTRTVSPDRPEGFEEQSERAQEKLDRERPASGKAPAPEADGEKGKIDPEKQKEALRKARRDMERMMSQLPGT